MRKPLARRERVVYPLLLLVVAGLVYVIVTGLTRADTTRQALCLFNAGLSADINVNARKLAVAREFARKHPHGALGFTQQQLKELNAKDARSLRAQRRRRDALLILHCPKGEAHDRSSQAGRR